MTVWSHQVRRPPEGHVHTAACDRIATVTWLTAEGSVHVWGIGAWCVDDEASIYAHFRRWVPKGTWLGVVIEPVRARRSA